MSVDNPSNGKAGDRTFNDKGGGVQTKWLHVGLVCLSLGSWACSRGGSAQDDVGRAALVVDSVPDGVFCLRVTAAGATQQVIKLLDVTPAESSSSFSLSGLPVGNVAFSADAVDATCASLAGSSRAPDWVSDPVVAQVSAQVVAQVNLVLRRNGRVNVSVGFDDGSPTGSLPPVSELPAPEQFVQDGVEGIFAQLQNLNEGPSPDPLTPLTLPPVPDTPADGTRFNLNQIAIEFQEGSAIRLRNGAFARDDQAAASTGGRLGRVGLEPGTVLADLNQLNKLLSAAGAMVARGTPTIDEADLDRLRVHAENATGVEHVDLNLFYFVFLQQPNAQAATKLLNAIRALRSVYAAYFQPVASPAEDIPPTTTIDVTPQENYFRPSPTGIDVDFARAFPGGTGSGVRVVDVENGWNLDHEDLPGSGMMIMRAGINFNQQDHGTAVLGEMWAAANSFGATGIVPDAAVGVSSTVFVGIFPFAGYGVANAALLAGLVLRPGDVELIEVHWASAASLSPCPNTCNCGQFGFVPVETYPFENAALRALVDAGVVVVEAAGNGQMTITRTSFDTGAIMVGASDTALGTVCSTNNGSRVDVQGWGTAIGTLGYGGNPSTGTPDPTLRANGTDPLQWYTTNFGGTSGASPIVVGAAALIQSTRTAAGLRLLTPLEMRSLLVATGTPQISGPPIGPLPNVMAAIGSYTPDGATFVSETQPPSPAELSQTFTITVSFSNSGGVAWTGDHTLGVAPANFVPGWTASPVPLGTPTSRVLPFQTVQRTFLLTAPDLAGTYDLAFEVNDGLGRTLATSPRVNVVVGDIHMPLDNAIINSLTAPGSLGVGLSNIVVVALHNNGTTTWQPTAYNLRITRTGAVSVPNNTADISVPVPPSGDISIVFDFSCSRSGIGGVSVQMAGPQGTFGQQEGATINCQ
jgi:hypothetical protein